MKLFRSIGLMSGTSMDGVDAALIESDGLYHIEFLSHVHIEYEASFQHDLQLLAEKVSANAREPVKLNELLRHYQDLIQQSTELHAQAVKQLLHETDYHSQDIDLIGYHGQTLYHSPQRKHSLQIGDGETLATLLKIPVVNDFRSNDIQHGGQGAPLAPIFHQALAVRDDRVPLAVVNCGGIANLSLIYGRDEDQVWGFDTGPGNVLIDRFVRHHTNDYRMDKDGQFGRHGQVDQVVLQVLYEKSCVCDGKNYYRKHPPKSLDTHDLQLIDELDSLTFVDACATLEAFTAFTILESLTLFEQQQVPHTWILAGGGWHNPVIKRELISRLEKLNSRITIHSADDIGWHSASFEAQMMAYLAIRAKLSLPISLPNITGVSVPLTGGKICM